MTDKVQFEREGFIIKRGVVPVESCQKAISYLFSSTHRTYGDAASALPFNDEDPDTIHESVGTESMLTRSGAGWRDRYIRNENWVWSEIVNHHKIRGTVESLVGEVLDPCHNFAYSNPDVKGADLRGIYAILPGVGTDRIHVDVHPFDCGVVVLLDAVPPNCGCFSIYPGSHQLNFEKSTTDLTQAHINRLGSPYYFSGDTGDVIFWHPNIAHQRQANISEQTRFTLFHDWVKKKDASEFKHST